MSDPTDPFENAADLGKILSDGVTQQQAENLAQVMRLYHQAYVRAGFTDEQSFTFILKMMEANAGGRS